MRLNSVIAVAVAVHPVAADVAVVPVTIAGMTVGVVQAVGKEVNRRPKA